MASTHLPSSYITAAQLASCIPSARSLEQQYPCLVLAAMDPPSHGYNQNTNLSAMQVPSSMILMNKEDDSSGYKGNPDWLSHGLPSQSMSPYVSLEQAFNDKQAQLHLASPIAINVLQSMSGKKDETNLPLPSEDAQGIGCLDGIETVINGMHEAWRMGNGLPNFVANTAQQNHWDSSLLPSIIPESTKGATKLSSFLGLKEAQNIKQEALLCQETKLEQDQGHQCNSTEMAKGLHSYLTAKRIQSTEGIREQGCNSTKKRKTTGEDQSASTNPQSSIQASENAEMGNGKRSKNSKASKKCGGKEINETYNKSMKEQSSVSDSSTTSCEKQVNGKESQILKSPSAEVREAPKQDYIHVRARRGQATDSHSLAERVRREKISERMKLLQSLVPSCNKVAGKALVLDEIINYVQSLQHQVEFLSMKLAAMNPTEGYFENYFNPGEVHKFGQLPVISTHGQPAAACGMITLPEISSLSQHRYVHVDEFPDGATINNDQILPETAGFMSTYLGW